MRKTIESSIGCRDCQNESGKRLRNSQPCQKEELKHRCNESQWGSALALAIFEAARRRKTLDLYP